TRVPAPIDGQVGDRLVDVGNLVGPTTLLTSVVSVDPMSASFEVDDNTFQRVQQDVREGKVKARNGIEIPVEMGLDIHKSAYPLKGTINFVNNQVDPKTGTIKVKADFPNPKPQVGERVLTPGLNARLRVPIGEPQKKLLIPEIALGSD